MSTFDIAGVGTVDRLGFGAMRITGPGIWGEPADRETARAVVRRAVELGVTLIDTADSYGPYVSEEIIAEAIAPYDDDVVVATKAGLVRTGPDRWHQVARREYLVQQAHLSLRRLQTDVIDLFQLHRIDSRTPREEQFETLAELRQEGVVKAIGLSEVSVADIEEASRYVPVATVQNRYNLTDRRSADVLAYCTENGIGFMPWAPVAAGEHAATSGPLARAAVEHDATPSQVALAWLLQASPVMLPIPGTGSIAHLEENLAANDLKLTPETVEELDALG
ncbi:aryl-alcohol dehydrogenase-like predicted oxidoreductase [Mumia flava]|uniref:Aryl-alcohol dehydrogenase-like predicted oxidoreductase n=1 Tax=Mumia flava TaxID=1348852 RepID=A0A0B2B2I9_9ACTN|nr:aldo/keto reductase [Mumia flava]PJJ54138.1 aryl-alcohol dehydrogenase-like predicted oxidoreductase [Mumia flava]